METAIASINKLIEEQRKINDDCTVNVITFSNKSEIVIDGVNLSKMERLQTFQANGGTALLDAVAYAVRHVEKSKADHIIIAAFTDGEENESKITSDELAKLMGEKEVIGWEFLYMIAANTTTRQRAMQMASKLGFGMIYGVDTNNYANSVQMINDQITRIRERNGINYAVPIAKSGYVRKMKVGNFTARLMRAPLLTDNESNALPPGAPVPVFPVDALPGCPQEWMRGEGCYVCPVDPDFGLWFDWTENDALNVAVLPSIKGMNPITGQKFEKLELEQYKNECPVHKTKFKEGRLCEECGHKWPSKSYVAHPDNLWLDGFRLPNGVVRQFFFTKDEQKDIASLIISKHNTVPAFGFAFFEPKTRRQNNIERSFFGPSGPSGPTGCTGPIGARNISVCDVYTMSYDGEAVGNDVSVMQTVSVGAGAKITQELADDVLKIEDWKEQPSGVIRLYFVFREQFKSIVENGGIKDLSGHPEGYLAKL
jgi:hypothetical protein